MRHRLERLIGISPLTAWWNRSFRSCLRVLVYHEVDDAVQFERQLRWLHEQFDLLSLQEVNALVRGSLSPPDQPLLISFDDARPSVYHNGMPVLKKYGIPSAVFVITSLVGTDLPYWWDEVDHYVPDRKKAQRLLAELKTMPDGARRRRLKTMRVHHSGDPLRTEQLAWDELVEMEQNGMVVANHTHTHPMLDQCEREAIRKEFRISMRLLDEHGLSGSSYLAYPNGGLDDTVVREAKSAGMKLGFCFDHRVNARRMDPWRISRLSVHSRDSLDRLQLICSGLHSAVLPLRKFFSNQFGI